MNTAFLKRISRDEILNFPKVNNNIHVTGSYITAKVIDAINGYTQVQSRNMMKKLGIRNIFIGLKLEFTCLSKETCGFYSNHLIINDNSCKRV